MNVVLQKIRRHLTPIFFEKDVPPPVEMKPSVKLGKETKPFFTSKGLDDSKCITKKPHDHF